MSLPIIGKCYICKWIWFVRRYDEYKNIKLCNTCYQNMDYLYSFGFWKEVEE